MVRQKARRIGGGRLALTLDGSEGGFVKSAQGGTIRGEVATHDLGPEQVQRKHITTLTYEPLEIEVEMGICRALYEWIQVSFEKGFVTRTAELIVVDANQQARATREFGDAYLSEVAFPTLDAASKDPAYMTVKITPETIRYSPGDGSQVRGTGSTSRKWLSSNFRFELGDLPCDRVTEIDSFTWRQVVMASEVGQFRAPVKQPAHVEVPNLRVTFSMQDLDAWMDWHRTFLIDGQWSEEHELSGSITLLAPDLKEELATIELMNVGLISLEVGAQEANKEQVSRVTVELYVQEMKFELGTESARTEKKATKRKATTRTATKKKATTRKATKKKATTRKLPKRKGRFARAR